MLSIYCIKALSSANSKFSVKHNFLLNTLTRVGRICILDSIYFRNGDEGEFIREKGRQRAGEAENRRRIMYK